MKDFEKPSLLRNDPIATSSHTTATKQLVGNNTSVKSSEPVFKGSITNPSVDTALLKELIVALCRDLEESLDEIPDGTAARLRCQAMLTEMQERTDKFSPLKLFKWLGFVEGVLWQCDVLSIDVQRNKTRPIIHAIHKCLGMDIPETIDVNKTR
jgi:hypothetical protein